MLSEKPRSGLSETRKMTKSTMEKKRRARINNSLTELKAILSGMITNKGERFDKMEKADILEMTVKCVKQLQKQSNTGDTARLPSFPADEDYRSGMHTCMSEVIKFISSSSLSDTDPEVKTKLLDHLANKLHSGTSHRMNTEPDSPCSTQKYIHENNTGVTNFDSGSLTMSDMSNDSNNNLQTINDKNTPLSAQFHPQKSPTETSPMPSPVFSPYKPVHPTLDTIQQPQSVPTVPLTILVPANICSAAVGTTCVIPLNLPTTSPQFGQNSVLAAVTQPSQTNFTINQGSGISLISASNFLQTTQASSHASEIINMSPEGQVFTFTPTIHRSPDNIIKAYNAIKPTAVTFPPILHAQNEEEVSSPLKLNTTTDRIPAPVLNHPNVAPLNEPCAHHMAELPGLVTHATHANENCAQKFVLKYGSKDSVNNLSNTVHEQTTQNRRQAEQEHLKGQNKVLFTEQRHIIETNRNASQPSRPFMFNSKPGNICDYSATSMWRPW